MKKSIIALSLLLCLGLTGCGEVLAGSYQTSAPHVDRPVTDEDSSAIRVENYRDLVSAVLYLVSQGESEGTLQFYDYPGDVETALTDACLEVATQDPLGAYCVDYIRHETTRVVSYDQATLSIHYRRTMEQVHSMVNVTGTSAIRTELQEALYNFAEEVVLRVAYFSEDEDSLTELVRQAYYDTPVAALGMPQVEINLYPASGRQRVVEILLTYPGDRYELSFNAADLSHMVEGIAEEYWELPAEEISFRAAQALWAQMVYDEEGPTNAYSALVEKRANSEGMALSYSLLCGRAFATQGWDCDVAEGIWKDGQGGEEPRFWNVITSPGGESLYFDATRSETDFYTVQEFFDLGYRWLGGPTEPEPAPEETGEVPAEGENP